MADHYISKVFYPSQIHGRIIYPFTNKKLDMAIYFCSGRRVTAELHEVTEFVEEVPSMIKLADIVDGEWFNLNRSLNMAKVKGAIAREGRSVTEDLLGEDDAVENGKGKGKKGKKAAVAAAAPTPAKEKAAGAGKGENVPDTKRFKIITEPKTREGSKAHVVFQMMKKSATVKDFKKLRVKNGMGNDLGGVAMGLIASGAVKLI